MVPKVIVGFAAVARCIRKVYICTAGSSWPLVANQRLSRRWDGVKKGFGGGLVLPLCARLLCGT